MKSILLIAITMVSSLAFAQRGPGGNSEARLNNLERLVDRQTQEIRLLNSRLNSIEDRMGRGEQRPPRYEDKQMSCLLISSSYGKTYLGTGLTSLAAEAQAKENCQKEVHGSYCSGGALKCDTAETTRLNNYTCIVTASSYGTTFTGSGKSQIEAEAKARIACQANYHGSYCSANAARCEGR